MLQKSFNDNWTCSKDVRSLASSVLEGESLAPVEVTLPHDAMIHETRSADNPSGNAGGFFACCNYIYSKTFEVPAEYTDKSLILEFEGVYHDARVYINGTFAGSCTNGYRDFCVDITPYINCGGENTVTVNVGSGDIPNSRWYAGAGIYRPVHLLVGGAVRIAPNGLKVSTPEVSEDVSEIETAITFESDLARPGKVYFATDILDAEGNVVASEHTPVTVFPGKTPLVYQRIFVQNARLWSLEDPYLYQIRTRVLEAKGCAAYEECAERNTLLDTAESEFGIRHIRIDPVHGLRLNGEEVLLRGACIHHDNGILGSATFDRAEERRVEILKQAGFNSIRMAHNAASKALLRACDRLGVLLMEESFDAWTQSKSPFDTAVNFTDEWEKDIDALIDKDYNHPCVFMYSIGNEIQELGTPAGAAQNREMANRCRQRDPNRYVTNAVNGLLTIMDDLGTVMVDLGLVTQEQLMQMMAPPAEDAQTAEEEAAPADNGNVNDVMTSLMGQMNYLATHHTVEEKLEEAFSGLDLSGYNYMSGRYSIDAAKYPNRIMYGSETLPPDIDINWKYVRELPQVLGDYTWTGYDYLGEAGVGVVEYNSTHGFFKPFPTYIGYCGDIDITGHRRPMSYYREIVWGLRKEPYIAVQYPQHYDDRPYCTPWSAVDSVSSWTWPGFEGKGARVEVYSAAEETELFLNGQSLGKQPTGEANRFKAVFDISYQPGALEAVSYTDGQETARFTLTTAGEASQLLVGCDRSVLKAGEAELSYLSIALADADGRLNTAASAAVAVEVEGAGTLQGFGSADPSSTENFFDRTRTTFNGKVLAAIRSGKEAGTAKVRVSAPGFDSVEVEITVQ